jgi:hypothetical protein
MQDDGPKKWPRFFATLRMTKKLRMAKGEGLELVKRKI